MWHTVNLRFFNRECRVYFTGNKDNVKNGFLHSRYGIVQVDKQLIQGVVESGATEKLFE